jgi:methylated-DNA-protein-cysteine methyltransferase related protein
VKSESARSTEPGPFEVVWRIVRRIPRGRVTTYGRISQMIDRRLTPLGVGWAIRAASEDSIPWQRVVNSAGGISTDDQHPGLQRAMLEAEGVRFGRNGRIDLEEYGWPGPSSTSARTRPRATKQSRAGKKTSKRASKKASRKKPASTKARPRKSSR